MLATMAHNFFHQADNFRMYYFDLFPLSSQEWRTTHAISHHLFPNTLYDFEISSLEPFIQFLPDPDKNTLYKLLAPVTSHMILVVAGIGEILKRLSDQIRGARKIRFENFFPFIELALMVFIVGNLTDGFK